MFKLEYMGGFVACVAAGYWGFLWFLFDRGCVEAALYFFAGGIVCGATPAFLELLRARLQCQQEPSGARVLWTLFKYLVLGYTALLFLRRRFLEWREEKYLLKLEIDILLTESEWRR